MAIGNLDETTQERLKAFATKEGAEDAHLRMVAARSAETIRVGTDLLIRAISGMTDEPLSGQDSAHKRAARLWSAGVLHLVGTHAANVGHLESSEITLARSITVQVDQGTGVPPGDRSYDRLTAQLSNFDPSVGAMVGFDRDFDPRGCAPTQLDEGEAILKLYKHDQEPRIGAGDAIERAQAWIGQTDMPSTYTGGEKRLGDPDRVAQIAQQMLQAVIDPGLNPELQTYEQVLAMSPELATQVVDTERPLSSINFSLVLPEWAAVGAPA